MSIYGSERKDEGSAPPRPRGIGTPAPVALEAMRGRGRRYDPKVLDALAEVTISATSAGTPTR